jgi:Farnesoic acid 0-methyl transferase
MRSWLAIPLVSITCLGACKVREQPPITETWRTDFTTGLGDVFYVTGDGYGVVNGALSAHGAHNHPLWLRKKLPHDVKIELDAWSTEPRGDIKIELFGDGHSYDPDGGRYTATGYEIIFGGWYNTKSIIARLDEHGTDMVQRAEPKVIANQHYHWRIERRRNVITWFVDDLATPFLRYEDPRPLEGSGHEYLGFNNWETDTWFDNLVITPL